MKTIYLALFGAILLSACASQEAPADEPTNDAAAKFEKNMATLDAYLTEWQNENVDYEKYFAKDFQGLPTAFGDRDTVNYEQNIQWDQWAFERYDFEIVDDPVNYLPGVDINTKELDGSVRFYAMWKLTKSATDSTEARTAEMTMYQAYVFNEEGKIITALGYGDFGGMMNYFEGADE